MLFHDALRRGDDALVRRLFFHLDEPRAALRWLDADDQELLFRKGEALDVLTELRNEMDDWGSLPVDILLKVLRDESASRPTRASAASLLALVHEPRIDQELAAFLTDESWGRTPPSGVERTTLNLLKSRSILEGDGSSPVLLAAIRSPSLQDSVLAAFLPDGTSRVLAPDVLMRMKGKRWDPEFWRNELSLLGGPLSGPMVELLVELLKDPDLAEDVARTMGRLMDPVFVEPLSALVLGPDGPDTNVKMAAVQALGAYLDDRTAEILLEGTARTSSEEVRETCFARLETIRRYQDERARWDGRATDKAARDGAVRELLAMLGDPAPAVRAQAARSLATLEAVKALPKIVALLKDTDAKVREAANEALKSLNAPRGSKAEPKSETKKP
jgi:HEAT repeat protein